MALLFYYVDMNLKELRLSKKLTQVEASLLCDIPLRSYKRLENDSSYNGTAKYRYAYEKIESYSKEYSDNQSSYEIAIVGAGYVGFSLAVLLSINNNVTVIDIKEDKVNKINLREPIFKDKEIEQYLKTKKLNLVASLPNKEIYKNKDFVIVSIPTDLDESTKILNTSNIEELVKEIREVNKSCLIIIKSTCYVGFTESLNDKNIIFSPEFLREGKALLDNLYPTRIIIGGDKTNPKVKRFAELLRDSANNSPKLLYMSSTEAEAVKLFSNTYLAMRVAYFNELDSFANRCHLNSGNIVQGVSLDNRIGDYYNNPSFGYGGYCLPKDTQSLISQVEDSPLISSIDESNSKRKEYIINDILRKLKDKKVVGIYSIQSKKDSDNIRHASILDIIKGLESNNKQILYYDMSKMTLDEFKSRSDIIIVNRYEKELEDVSEKVYTRDLFKRD